MGVKSNENVLCMGESTVVARTKHGGQNGPRDPGHGNLQNLGSYKRLQRRRNRKGVLNRTEIEAGTKDGHNLQSLHCVRWYVSPSGSTIETDHEHAARNQGTTLT